MKRTVCLILSLLLIFAALIPASALSSNDPDASSGRITADEAVAAYAAETGEKVETYRYYFRMPDGVHGMRDENGNPVESWYNEYTDGAGVYWWHGAAACKSWPGYRAMLADAGQHIYYVNMPTDVIGFIWNNGVDGGMDASQPIYDKARQTVDLSCEPAEPGEYETIPEGCDSFDGCIYILKSELPSTAILLPGLPADGAWYFYYGDGCYGMYDEESANFRSVDENCCNPDHFDADGRHIGDVPENALRGDYDKDGEITILDATRVQRILAELSVCHSGTFLELIDADGDGELTIMDATRIQNVVAELMDMDGSRTV